MKKSILLLSLIITLLHSCKKEELINNDIIFSGKIENPTSNKLQILNEHQDVLKSINIIENNFRDTLDLSEGYYFLGDGQEYISFYLKPSFDLHLSLDAQDFDNSIIYEGKGASENNYLVKKNLLLQSFGELNYYGYYAKLSENKFLKLADSLFNVQKDLLEKSIDLDTTFSYVEYKSLEFDKLNKYSSFEYFKNLYSKNKDFEVSENYPDPYENIDLSNENILLSSSYMTYIQSYLIEKSDILNSDNNENSDYVLGYVDIVHSEIKNDLVKQSLLFIVGKYQLNFAKNIDSVYNKIKPALINESYLNEVTDNYNRLRRIAKGATSPNFQLNDINGESVSLTDLRGNIVYIDIWATSCLPCIKEFPSLKKLGLYFKNKNIELVSISKDEKEDPWRKMVEDKELGGIQLIAPNDKISFFEDYKIIRIPRFILIDQNGKIIDADAKWPSDPELIKEIEQYLLDSNS